MVSTSGYLNSSVNLSDYDNGAQAGTMQEYSVPSDLFIVSDTTDSRIEADVMDPVLKNLFDKSKNAFIRFHTNKLVNNPMLRQNFERCRQKLQLEGRSAQEHYGFIQLPDGDRGEEDELCAYGVRVGINYQGELADASKGVYLSRYADACSPCPFINDQCLRVLICKVLLGKSRKIQPSTTNSNANVAPDPNYNSYVVATSEDLRPETTTPHSRYINSLMYVYEYVDKNSTADRPSSIYPLSIAEIQCNKPGSDFLNILVPRNNNSLVWTGNLQLQRFNLKHVTMHSHFPSVGRPRGMDVLQFKTMVPYDTVVNCMPIVRLLQPELVGALLHQPELTFEDHQTPIMHIQYFFLQSTDCEEFENLCTLMRKYELVGINKLPSGTYLFLIPNGGLSLKLGLCLFNTATFHCISVSSRSSNQANTNWQQDPLIDKLGNPPSKSMISAQMIASRFRRNLPPPVASVAPQTFIPQNIVSPMNFRVPPPNFRVPPPNFSVPPPSTTRFLPAGPNVHRPPMMSRGDHSVTKIEDKPIGQGGTLEKVNATPQEMDKLLNVLTKKQNSMDPRLSANKLNRQPDQSAGSSTNNHGNKLENKVGDQSNALKQPWYGSEVKKEEVISRKRSRSFDDEGQLEIVEDSSPVTKEPEEHRNSRKRSSNFGNPEDIDLRGPTTSSSFNGRSSLPSPRLVNIPTNMNSSATSRNSRLGSTFLNLDSPGLVSPSQLNPNQLNPSQLNPRQLNPRQLNPSQLRSNPFGNPFANSSSLLPSRLDNSAVTSTTSEKVIVVLDPELIVSPSFNPDQLRQIFALTRENNEKSEKPTIIIKWHSCINEELRKQINEGPANSFLMNRAQRIRDVLTEFVDLFELINPHLCDKDARTVHKSLICAMNIKRLHKNARLIFLSAGITSNSPQASNFESNDIDLQSPDQFLQLINKL